VTLRAREDALRRVVATARTDAAHGLAHVARVWANAKTIAAAEGGDLGLLMPAAYLHDLVNLPKSHPDNARASRLSARAARPHLIALGYSAAQIDAIAHAIAAHSFSAQIPAETLEAKILQDADRLDALGSIGLARWLMISGQLGRRFAHPDDPFAADRPLDQNQWSLDHYAIKLLPMTRTMQTATGARLAQERLKPLSAFVAALCVDLGKPLTPHFGAIP